MERCRRQIATEGRDGRVRTRSRHVLHGVGEREVRIAFELLRIEDDVPNRIAVCTDETPAVIVKREAELALSTNQFEVAGPRVVTGVAGRELEGRTFRMRGR